MRGAHDDGSHGSKCLMGLRPAMVRLREWRGELGMGVGNSRDNMPQREASYELSRDGQRAGNDHER